MNRQCNLNDFVDILRENEVAVVCDLIRRDVQLVVAALSVRPPAVEVLWEQPETLFPKRESIE